MNKTMDPIDKSDTQTVAVLALDACDYRLVERWDCTNLKLDHHAPLATFGSERHHGYPLTLDVWPAVAHGERIPETSSEAVTQEWDNPLLRAASMLTRQLPRPIRAALGAPFRALGASDSFSTTSGESMFDAPGRSVTNWPGVTDSPRLQTAWQLCGDAVEGNLTDAALQRDLVDGLHTGVDDLLRATDRGDFLAGTHVHILDVAGHVYADDEAMLRDYYGRVDRTVGRLRDQVDELVLLSDHGMQVEWLNDPEPSEHSFDALVAATGGVAGLPETVVEVRGWLDSHLENDPVTQSVDAAVSRDQLSALGYVDSEG